VEGVNDHPLDHCQVSIVPHYCSFKEQEIPTIYTVWMVIYLNSNVNQAYFRKQRLKLRRKQLMKKLFRKLKLNKIVKKIENLN